jgi:type I restriction enzyme R subunit
MSHDQNSNQKASETLNSKQTGNLKEDFKYDGKQVDRDLVTVKQIKELIHTFKGKLPFIFPGKKS